MIYPHYQQEGQLIIHKSYARHLSLIQKEWIDLCTLLTSCG